MPKPTVFLSYSHRDEGWKDLLRPHLRMLEHLGTLEVWDDRRIDAGDTWYPEIKQAMEGAAAAVCLISADYLASDFCVKEEIPYLLERREKDGMYLLPLLVSDCLWNAVPWLRSIQMLPRDGKVVESDFRGQENVVFKMVAQTLLEKLGEPTRGLSFGVDEPIHRSPPQPEKEDLTRLPVTGAELFGRQQEIEWLDAAWDEDHIRIAALVAWGGVGKSTLVNKWLERMRADGFRGARRVFGWSFFSQGTNERATSADLFIETALTFFGDPEPSKGSPWAKGERLAELVRHERSLLVLDGLEPLQSAVEGGRVKDPALAMLLAGLARTGGAGGLCVVTTRERVGDLEPLGKAVEEKNLEQISPEAGRALLRVRGMRGTDAELEDVVRAFGGHALAINLLASYLRDVPGHPATAALAIPDLPLADEQGPHPRRVMEAFAQRYDPGPEMELLLLLGLFDRPAAAGALDALRAEPEIPGLTQHLARLSAVQWLQLVEELRVVRLLAEWDPHEPGSLDAHPLVREHFGEKLEKENPQAWREAHGRLFEYYRNIAEPYPATLEGLAPLYAAVAHGCAAGRHQEALDDIYWARIQRREEFFPSNKLGVHGADLAALASFFAEAWRLPVTALSEADQGFIFNQASFRLQSLGRLAEAIEPMQGGLQRHRGSESWKQAATAANNLSQLASNRGILSEAIRLAEQSVALAHRSGEVFPLLLACCRLAAALHQTGEIAQAGARFREAEERQGRGQPQYPKLYSVQGFEYCDFLLDRGEYQDVEKRANASLEIARQNGWLLDMALDHLSIGRALLLQATGKSDLRAATEHLDEAVDGLRQAGEVTHIPRGLLARARLRLVQRDNLHARADLDEALLLATRCGMRLHEADAHLGFVRLHLAEGKKDDTRASLERARKLVEETGYHRRDGELAELAAALG